MLGLNMEKKSSKVEQNLKLKEQIKTLHGAKKILNGTKNYTWNKTKLCRGGGGRAGVAGAEATAAEMGVEAEAVAVSRRRRSGHEVIEWVASRRRR
jgi:hypothetical protein